MHRLISSITYKLCYINKTSSYTGMRFIKSASSDAIARFQLFFETAKYAEGITMGPRTENVSFMT